MRPQDRALFNLLAFCTGVVIVLWLLTGCVTLHDCNARVNGALHVGCQWAFSAAPLPCWD